MREAALYQPPGASPTTFGIVILLHGAALTALALSKMDMPKFHPEPPIKVINLPIKEIPDPIPPEPTPRVERVTRIDPIVPPPPRPPEHETIKPTELASNTIVGPVTPFHAIEPEPPRPMPPIPVRRGAQIDPRSELKPPYPPSEQRMGTEGSVTVRVLIGADGRVKAAEKVRATNDAFYQATLRHAMRNWRFKPATVDGRPIESSMVMTLHFKLDGDA
jgi:protein TonB